MKTGFIGTGNMGGAIMKGLASAENIDERDIYIYDIDEEKTKAAALKYGVCVCESQQDVMALCDVVFLGVKPDVMGDVLEEISPVYTTDKTVISMAAGISIETIEEYLGESAKIVRIMPNTPALVGQAMTAMFINSSVGTDDADAVYEMLSEIGRVELADEEMIHCIIGVSGSSPAYTYMYIKALMDSAVSNGMSPEMARTFAAQAVIGAAEMVLQTGEDPEVLRDNVCSKGGTTIEAVKKLQSNGFADNIREAFDACVKRSKEMTR